MRNDNSSPKIVQRLGGFSAGSAEHGISLLPHLQVLTGLDSVLRRP
jgi:hypothetical protein